VKHSDGTISSGTLDDQGRARVEASPAASAIFAFPACTTANGARPDDSYVHQARCKDADHISKIAADAGFVHWKPSGMKWQSEFQAVQSQHPFQRRQTAHHGGYRHRS